MKKLLSAIFALATVMTASAQFNLQLHYDLGRTINKDSESNRQLFTTTAEFFRADRLGSTFLFIDLDYKGKGENNDGVLGAYWEIGRDFTFYKLKNTNSSLTAHVEYDGGCNVSSGPFQQALLAGPAWQWHSNDFSKTFTFQALYKQFLKHGTCKSIASFQATAVWGITFAQGLCTFSGFADLWYGYIPAFDATGAQKKGMVFLTEPQFWVNVMGKNSQNDKLSIGTEIEMSNNFVWATGGDDTFFVNPTLAVKYTF